MKNKIFTLMFASIFALVFLVGGVDGASSGVFTISNLNTPSNVDEDAGSFTFTFNITYTGSCENQTITFINSTTNIGMISIPSVTGLNGTANESVTVTGTINNFANLGGNTLNAVINATTTVGTLSRDDQTTFSVPISSTPPTSEISKITEECSTIGNPGKLRIKKISFGNQGFSGNVFGKGDVWFLLDEIDFEIEIDNRGDEKIEDIEVQWGVYDTKKGKWMIELEEEKDFDLKSSKSNVLTGSFKINNKMDLDFDELSDGENYVFYVIATGTVDNETSPLTCTYDSKTAELIIDDDFVVLADLNVQETASCGEDVHLTAKVWNIGDDEQDDVLVKIYNKELGINIIKEYSTIDEFEYENLDVLIKIPKDAEEKIYILNFEVYDEDGSIFESDYKDRESRFIRTIKVEGNCKSSISSDAIVTATLTSGGRAGQPMVITSTITNIGDETSTYTINAATYAGWANSVEISPQTLIVASGNSGQVTFTFDIKKEAFGTNNFDIGVLSEEQLVMTQPVSVQIEKSGFSLTGGAISTTTYLITGSIIAVLILIAIVILIIRLIK